jgi:small subunit ribosomal protein S9
MDDYGRVYSTGKRKTSVARVWIKEGSGQFLVNGKRVNDYFTEVPRDHCMSPLVCAKTAGYFDVWCTVKGGGTSGKS